jgi:hypothetical protein
LSNKHKVLFATFVLALTAVSAAETSDPVSNLWQSKFQLRVGAFFPDLDSSIRIDSDLGGVGDGLDFERDLGMPDHKSTLYGGASWQISSKHVLEWEFFDLGRDGRTITDRSWNIGDATILANGRIDSAWRQAPGRSGNVSGLNCKWRAGFFWRRTRPMCK